MILRELRESWPMQPAGQESNTWSFNLLWFQGFFCWKDHLVWHLLQTLATLTGARRFKPLVKGSVEPCGNPMSKFGLVRIVVLDCPPWRNIGSISIKKYQTPSQRLLPDVKGGKYIRLPWKNKAMAIATATKWGGIIQPGALPGAKKRRKRVMTCIVLDPASPSCQTWRFTCSRCKKWANILLN